MSDSYDVTVSRTNETRRCGRHWRAKDIHSDSPANPLMHRAVNIARKLRMGLEFIGVSSDS